MGARERDSRGAMALGSVAFLLAATAPAHDMFLVVPDHAVPANAKVTVALYNGTFAESLNAIDRERMVDVSIADGQGGVSHPGVEQWRELGNQTLLDFETGAPGSWVVGVSTSPRMIELTGEEFDEYLEHDGVRDVLDERRRQGRLGEAARERYSKHVKTLLSVGGETSDGWSTRLGYPVEIVPLANPATLAPGDVLGLLVLDDGEPAAGQLVYASYAGHHAHDSEGAHREAVMARTDADGRVSIELTHPGRWYARLIRMLPAEEPDVDYESRWATLTFAVGS